ncbi:MAG: efflux RND transporter periplasmic adaptor subunit [Bacteroidetes bacterium]|jgi:RND family efflux transporter MFP subunit|nr:efflux RND transporter periplasmic adaptor subunit [Bacteroidota bacterium]NBC26771.1 efflux RND transporter periplasmic adaptor subunit [Bacteroidota bacterium]
MNSSTILITFLSLLFILQGCKKEYSQPPSADRNETVPVRVEPLAVQTSPIPVQSSGRLETASETNLSFLIGGIIEHLNFSEGASFQEGDTLASLDLVEIDAQVQKAREALAKARRDLERITGLYSDSSATLEQVQDTETALEIAEAEYEIATFNRRHASITAPGDGVILKKYAEEQELSTSGTPVYRIGITRGNRYLLKTGLTDKDVLRIRNGNQAEVYFDAYPGRAFNATVTEVPASADPRTGTYEVELSVESEGALLKSGFIGKAMIFPSSSQPYYRIPLQAMVEGGQHRARIFVPLENGTAEPLDLTPDYIGNDFFTIDTTGVAFKHGVITEGASYLRPGIKISIYSSN